MKTQIFLFCTISPQYLVSTPFEFGSGFQPIHLFILIRYIHFLLTYIYTVSFRRSTEVPLFEWLWARE